MYRDFFLLITALPESACLPACLLGLGALNAGSERVKRSGVADNQPDITYRGAIGNVPNGALTARFKEAVNINQAGFQISVRGGPCLCSPGSSIPFPFATGHPSWTHPCKRSIPCFTAS
eukprot:1157239-Pelagomonas_calceolata.AAC.10